MKSTEIIAVAAIGLLGISILNKDKSESSVIIVPGSSSNSDAGMQSIIQAFNAQSEVFTAQSEAQNIQITGLSEQLNAVIDAFNKRDIEYTAAFEDFGQQLGNVQTGVTDKVNSILTGGEQVKSFDTIADFQSFWNPYYSSLTTEQIEQGYGNFELSLPNQTESGKYELKYKQLGELSKISTNISEQINGISSFNSQSLQDINSQLQTQLQDIANKAKSSLDKITSDLPQTYDFHFGPWDTGYDAPTLWGLLGIKKMPAFLDL